MVFATLFKAASIVDLKASSFYNAPPFWVSYIKYVVLVDAGWSSLVARRAHNPKVVGSNPAPATKSGREEPSALSRCLLVLVLLVINEAMYC